MMLLHRFLGAEVVFNLNLPRGYVKACEPRGGAPYILARDPITLDEAVAHEIRTEELRNEGKLLNGKVD